MFKTRDFKKKGFTLIELLVVISIISLLASVVLASLNTVREHARDSTRITQVREIQKALELYYSDNGNYPHSYTLSLQYDSTAAHTINSTTETDWRAFMESLKPHINSTVVDPINDSTYNFKYFSSYYGPSGQWYYFTFRLEDPDHSIEDIDGAYSWGCQGYYRDLTWLVELGVTNCKVQD